MNIREGQFDVLEGINTKQQLVLNEMSSDKDKLQHDFVNETN